MPESRDRLERPLDIEAMFARRRSGALGILREDVVGVPIRQFSIGLEFGSLTPRRGGTFAGARPGMRAPRSVTGRGQNALRTPAPRNENTPPAGMATRGRGRLGNSVLPHWYPRTPLRDITAVVRAIDRRGTLRAGDGHGAEDIVAEGERLAGLTTPGPRTPLQPIIALATPSAADKHSTFSAEKMSKTLRKFSTVTPEDPEFLTPQKKLLDSIETVEKILLEDLQRLKRTPTAIRAEKEKKIRTLMSMR